MKESKAAFLATFLVTFMYVMIKLSYVPQILHVLNIFSKKRCQLSEHCGRKHPWAQLCLPMALVVHHLGALGLDSSPLPVWRCSQVCCSAALSGLEK